METEQLSGISALHQQKKPIAIGGLVKNWKIEDHLIYEEDNDDDEEEEEEEEEEESSDDDFQGF
jgi:ribosomal protein L12E/L44/L45/RPP1/RPP2